ncbi:MAG: type II toxin-antitoxin system RelE/ParE family toxin [Geobacteraceae bacterium]|nr:type II toxin-antitoxin system RelE/ParE family toxin [Geobacteraceae bacterium]
MKTKHKITWATVAENDLRKIIEYIARDNVANARQVLARIKEKASALDQLPDRGRIVPELQDYGITLYREIVVAPWRIIYRTSDQQVHVLAVIDSRQNVEDILLGRLIKELKIY